MLNFHHYCKSSAKYRSSHRAEIWHYLLNDQWRNWTEQVNTFSSFQGYMRWNISSSVPLTLFMLVSYLSHGWLYTYLCSAWIMSPSEALRVEIMYCSLLCPRPFTVFTCHKHSEVERTEVVKKMNSAALRFQLALLQQQTHLHPGGDAR
jgi:hypothetical protein